MEFRLELFVEDLQRSISFFEEVIGLTFHNKTEVSAIIKMENFSLLLTSDNVLKENHYFKKDCLRPKGKGVEVVILLDNIEQTYQRVLDKNYPVESSLKMQSWGMKDFRIIDPDGYYLRLSSYKD